MHDFDLQPVSTTREAIDALSSAPGEASILAGGTDLLDLLKEGLVRSSRLVNLKSNEALRDLRFDGARGLSLGACVTLGELEQNEHVVRHYPAIARALAVLASPQIRNMATVAGNLCQRPRCWYFRDEKLPCRRKGGTTCFAATGENTYHAILGGQRCYIVHPSDLAPAFMAYGATITVSGPNGSRELPLGEFFVGPGVDITRETVLEPGEVVERVQVPAPASGSRGIFLKVRDRRSWDFATVSVAAVLEMDGRRCRKARVVLGAVAPVPWAVPEVEALLEGQEVDVGLATRAGEAAVAEARPLADNAYKVGLTQRLVRRALIEAAGGEWG